MDVHEKLGKNSVKSREIDTLRLLVMQPHRGQVAPRRKSVDVEFCGLLRFDGRQVHYPLPFG